MRKILIVTILSVIFTYLPINFVKADVNFSNIEVYEMINGNARLKWNTNVNTRAEIYYGLDQDNLDKFMGYSLYDRWHETVLTGLEKDETYYYKIKAIEASGETTETFIMNFSTDDMEDTIRPDFEEARILQTTHSAVALRWITDEITKATIYYGTNPDSLTKKSYYRKYYNFHTQLIYKLKSGEKYYFKIKAIDKDGNFRERLVSTTIHATGSSSLNISDIEPISPNDDLITARTATIKWETNLIAKGVIYYGTSAKRLSKRIYVSPYKKENHEAKIENLIPNKTYYYKIKAYKSLYNKSKKSNIMSFTTKALDNQYKVGSLVKGSDSKVYVIKEDGKRAWVKNEEIFLGLGYRWQMIKNISDEDLNEYLDTKEITSTKTHPDGTLIKYADKPTIYLMEGGKKRPFFTEKAFTRKGYSFDDVIILSSKKKYRTGKEVF